MAMGRTTVMVLVSALLVGLTGCSIRTAGAPQGDLNLKATFDDVQGLVVGHSVQMADVKVGSVTEVELDPRTYKATATLSIADGHRIPKNTIAEIKVTSLLGENYVDLMLPPGGSLDRGPFLATGDAIANTSVQPAFEQVVGQAGPLLQALAGNDIATVVNTGAAALDGNGQRLNATIRKSSELLKVFTAQRNELLRSVDQFARLGRSLAEGGDDLAKVPGELQKTTELLNDNKHKILRTVEKLTKMAKLLNDKVLEGRVLRFRKLLNDLDPVLAELGGNRTRLTKLVNGLVSFSTKLPKASYDGQLLLYPLVNVTWPDGTPVLPQAQGGGQGGARTRSEPGNVGQAPKPSKLPEGLEGALPDLADLLEPPR